MKIQILVDNKDSWIVPYVHMLIEEIEKRNGIRAVLHYSSKDVTSGDILFLLSCEKIFRKLSLNTHNIVVHESELPKGKGWSPLSWQVLEGKKRIPVTLFEAAEKVDSGDIYLQEFIYLDGTELLPELKHKQGMLTNKMILDFIDLYPNISAKKQVGEETSYKKRNPQDSELSLNKTLGEQFNLLRICDNERYPAFFVRDGIKYVLRISKE